MPSISFSLLSPCSSTLVILYLISDGATRWSAASGVYAFDTTERSAGPRQRPGTDWTNLPGRFRSGNQMANPVFLTDRKISSQYSPYVYVSNGSHQVNNVRLVIGDFFGTFVATNRYYMSRTWMEVNLYNFRLLMDTDETCVHTLECGHDMVHVCTPVILLVIPRQYYSVSPEGVYTLQFG